MLTCGLWPHTHTLFIPHTLFISTVLEPTLPPPSCARALPLTSAAVPSSSLRIAVSGDPSWGSPPAAPSLCCLGRATAGDSPCVSSQGSLAAALGSQHWLQQKAVVLLPGRGALPGFLPSLLWDMQRLSIQCWQQAAVVAKFGQSTSASTTKPRFHCLPLVLLGCW